VTTLTTAAEFCSATGKQVTYLVSLVAERAVPDADARSLIDVLNAGHLDVPTASEWIERFKSLPERSE
jgi:hypothetical protein